MKNFFNRVALGIVTVALSIAASYGVLHLMYDPAPSAPTNLTARVVPFNTHEHHPLPLFKHAIYPYSVMPGGVHNLADLERARAAGLLPGDFDLTKVTRHCLEHDVDVHMTFSKDGSLHWTQKTVHVKAGECVFTDGKYTVLERCGNLILTSLPTPSVIDIQPAPTDLSIPLIPNEPKPSAPGFVSSFPPVPPTVPPSSWPGPPVTPPIYVCCPVSPPPPPICPPPPTHTTVPSGDNMAAIIFLTMLVILVALALREHTKAGSTRCRSWCREICDSQP